MIRAPRAVELNEIAAFVAVQQASPESRDAMLEDTAAAIAAQLDGWQAPWPETSRVAEQDGHLIGFVGAELDESLRRVWIHGPVVDARDWDEVADALLSTLEADVPGIAGKEGEIAADVANERLAALAVHRGFVAGKVHHLLVIGAPRIENLPQPVLSPVPPGLGDAFVALHEEIFPATYYSGRQLLEQAGRGDAVVLAAVRDGVLLGYAAGRIDEAGDGYLDFVGVATDARRGGLGRALVAGIAHAFSELRPISAMRLTVSSENTAALALYDGLGFERQSSAIGYRRPARPPV